MEVRSYGKFKQFEIRDCTYVVGIKDNNLETEVMNADEVGKYDLIVWLGDDDSRYCVSIATLIYDDDGFTLKSVGTRYLEYGTQELNKWLLKWTELKSLERGFDD